jgi:hypothetical protein
MEETIEQKIIAINKICYSEDKKVVFNDGCYVTGTNPTVEISYYTYGCEGQWCAELMVGNSYVRAVKNENNNLVQKEVIFYGDTMTEAVDQLLQFCILMTEKGFIFVDYEDVNFTLF